MAEDTSRVRIDDLTHAAFAGVLRALDERRLDPKKWPGPILVGIIAWPELGPEQFRGEQVAAAGPRRK